MPETTGDAGDVHGAADPGTLVVAYMGNFRPEHSTENHVRQALTNVGHSVVEYQEDEPGSFKRLGDDVAAGSIDLVLWTRTWGADVVPPDEALGMLDRSRTAGIATVGYHLDRWWGLDREVQVTTEPYFRCAMNVTADGGHDDEWAAAGVNHVWFPPGVLDAETRRVGTFQPSMAIDVAFVGTWKAYHAEWAYRRELVLWLRKTYGSRRFRVWERGVRGQALVDLYRSATVIVGDSCLAGGATRYWSDRIPETLGRGGVLVHPFVEGMEPHFTAGTDFAGYELGRFDQLHEQIEGLLADSSKRAHMSAAGRTHVRVAHTYEVRMRALVELLRARGMLPR